MSYVAIGAGVIAILALAYAVYSIRAATTQTLSASAALTEAGRNLVATEKQRDTEKAARDKAEAELADATAQLKATQEALAKVSEKDADEVAAAVRSAPDASDALDGVLASSARSDVPDGTDASPADGHQG